MLTSLSGYASKNICNKASYLYIGSKALQKPLITGVQDALEVYKDNRVFDFVNSSEVFEIFTSTEGMNLECHLN